MPSFRSKPARPVYIETRPINPTSEPARPDSTSSVADVLAHVPRLDGPNGEVRKRDGAVEQWINQGDPGVMPSRQAEIEATTRPDWQTITPPAEVVGRWATISGLAQRADELRDAVQAIPGQKADERRRIESEMVAAIERGETADSVGPLTDWAHQKLALVTAFKVVRDQLLAARIEYDAIVATAAPAWRDRLVAEVAPARARAQELAGPALSAVGEWQTAIRAAHQLSEALDATLPPPVLAGAAGERVGECRRSPELLAELLANDDPRVSGEYLTLPDDGVRPTLWMRQAMATDGAYGGWPELAAIEHDEHYSVTAITRREARDDRPTGVQAGR